jgi:hypothetical protein
MKKTVKLTESDLSKIIQRVINEQQLAKAVKPKNPDADSPIPKDHPINNPLWIEMTGDVEGDGVETIKYVPNKMLVIDAFGVKYTITKG